MTLLEVATFCWHAVGGVQLGDLPNRGSSAWLTARSSSSSGFLNHQKVESLPCLGLGLDHGPRKACKAGLIGYCPIGLGALRRGIVSCSW